MDKAHFAMAEGYFPFYTTVSQHPETIYRTLPLSVFDSPFFNESHAAFIETQPQNLADTDESLVLSGIIFHSAHCGSTLLSRMLSHSGKVRSVNESDAINGLLLSYRLYAIDEALVIDKLQKIVQAYAQMPGERQHLVLKMSSWNVFLLSLIRKAFPKVPWLYLYREEDALVESLLARGEGFVKWYDLPTDLMVRAFVPREIALPDKAAYLRQMSRLQFELAQHSQPERGMILRYPEFLDDFSSAILPHFGLSLNDAEMSAALSMRQFDGKSAARVLYPTKS